MLFDVDTARELALTVPSFFKSSELTKNLSADLQIAKPIEDLHLLLNPSASETYFSYLADICKKNPALDVVGSKEDLHKAEGQLICAMFRDHYPYSFIIETMTNSPAVPPQMQSSAKQLEQVAFSLYEKKSSLRWIGASGHVVSILNPIVQSAEIETARSFHEHSHYRLDDEEIYYSALRTIWERDPSASLADADRFCVKLLQENQMDREQIKKVLSFSPQYSFQYIPDESVDATVERVALLEHISETLQIFLDETMKEDLSIPPYNKEITRPEPSDVTFDNEQVLRELVESLDTLHRQQEESDALSFWTKMIQTIEDNFSRVQFEKQKTVCKMLVTWSDAISKAMEQMDLDKSPELEKIHQDSVRFAAQSRLELDDWARISGMTATLDCLSKTMLSETAQKIRLNPLLKNPSIYMATPFEVLIQTKMHTPKQIYFSCLRKAVLDSPGIGIYEADVAVKKTLDTLNINTQAKTQVLSHSPRYDHLPPKTKESSVNQWLSTLAHQEKRASQK